MILSVLYIRLLIKAIRIPTSRSISPLIINSVKLIVVLVDLFLLLIFTASFTCVSICRIYATIKAKKIHLLHHQKEKVHILYGVLLQQ